MYKLHIWQKRIYYIYSNKQTWWDAQWLVITYWISLVLSEISRSRSSWVDVIEPISFRICCSSRK